MKLKSKPVSQWDQWVIVITTMYKIHVGPIYWLIHVRWKRCKDIAGFQVKKESINFYGVHSLFISYIENFIFLHWSIHLGRKLQIANSKTNLDLATLREMVLPTYLLRRALTKFQEILFSFEGENGYGIVLRNGGFFCKGTLQNMEVNEVMSVSEKAR